MFYLFLAGLIASAIALGTNQQEGDVAYTAIACFGVIGNAAGLIAERWPWGDG